MAKPRVSPEILAAVRTAKDIKPTAAKRQEASPRTGATEIQSIRPARTAIAHRRGGNKGK